MSLEIIDVSLLKAVDILERRVACAELPRFNFRPESFQGTWLERLLIPAPNDNRK